jgi:hypothetical protein
MILAWLTKTKSEVGRIVLSVQTGLVGQTASDWLG